MSTAQMETAMSALETARRVLAEISPENPAPGPIAAALAALADAVSELPAPGNLNVNVRTAHTGGECVELSYDGAPFVPRATFAHPYRPTMRTVAEHYAIAYAAGYRAAGGRVLNLTSHGEAI